MYQRLNTYHHAQEYPYCQIPLKEIDTCITSFFHGNHLLKFAWLRDAVKGFTILRTLHIYPIEVFHQPDSILIDSRLGFTSGRIAVEYISNKMSA